MRIIIIFTRLMLIFTLVCCQGLPVFARTVTFVRTVHFQKKSGKSTLPSVFFGKKKEKEINPVSICRIGQNRLCVTDSINGAVIIIDENGNIKKKVTRVKGIKIISPVSACGDEQGNLYVSDSGNRVVLKFDSRYKFDKIFLSPSQARITGIIFSRDLFYCVDTQNHRVLCFDRKGELKFSFGERGSGNGEFNFPTHITADNEYIYITDAMNFRVQIFDHKGTFVKVFGTFGRGGGNFSKPKGIAVDREKRIFVADAMFDNIQVFDFSGQFLHYFGGPGHQNGEFWMPMGIMMEGNNSIWVADTYNNRLQLFHLQEDMP